MVAGSELYQHAIVDVMAFVEGGENETLIAMLDVHGNQLTLRLRDTAVRSLQRVLERGATKAPE